MKVEENILRTTDEAVASIVDRLQEFAVEYGSDAFDVVMGAVQLEGARGLFSGLTALIVLAVCITLFVGCVRRYDKIVSERGEAFRNDAAVKYVFFCIPLAIGGIGSIFSVADLLDAWNWFALFYPEVAAAHKLLGL